MAQFRIKLLIHKKLVLNINSFIVIELDGSQHYDEIGIKKDREQILLGVTGSGKTFTMANIIANVNKPTLILAHNKTLAAQLCSEFREFFPENAVEYFIS